jgi:hypothetical protein
MARANSDACGVVGAMWNLWRRRRDAPALRTLVYTREGEPSFRELIPFFGGWAPAAPNLWLWEARAQTTVPASPTSNASLCECMHLTTHRTRSYRRHSSSGDLRRR